MNGEMEPETRATVEQPVADSAQRRGRLRAGSTGVLRSVPGGPRVRSKKDLLRAQARSL